MLTVNLTRTVQSRKGKLKKEHADGMRFRKSWRSLFISFSWNIKNDLSLYLFCAKSIFMLQD